MPPITAARSARWVKVPRQDPALDPEALYEAWSIGSERGESPTTATEGPMGELWIAGSTPPAVIRPEQSRGCHVGVHFPTGTGSVDLSRERRGFFLGWI
jgi:hypothetical protein